MKKLLVFVFVAIMILSFVGCSHEKVNSSSQVSSETNSAESTEEEIITCVLGETVETDIIRFTLERSDFAIALYDGRDGNWEKVGLPKEHDPNRDRNNLNVAGTGHTLLSYTYTAENLDRVDQKFDSDYDTADVFLTVTFNGESYDCRSENTYDSRDGFEWDTYMMDAVYLEPQEKLHFRKFVDLPVEVSDFTESVEMTFYIPTSSGVPQKFTYVITEEDRAKYAEQEISLDDAIKQFTTEQGFNYFKDHMDEFSVMTGEDITEITKGDWNICLKGENFSSEQEITFGESVFTYYYKTTPVDIEWSITDNIFSMYMSSGTYNCEVRVINDSAYLFVCDGVPFGVIYK